MRTPRASGPGSIGFVPRAATLPGPSRREPPPNSRQVLLLARALAAEAGYPWPATRAEAAALIAHLRGEAAAVRD